MSNEFVTRAAAAGIELPDPTGAPDGQVPTTTGGVYGLATPAGGVAVSSATPQPVGVASAGVSADASRADHVHERPTAITTPSLASATGWTATNNLGTATINTLDARAEIGIPAGGLLTAPADLPRITRATALTGDWELRARLVAYTGGALPRAVIGLDDVEAGNGWSVQVWIDSVGSVELLTRASGTLTGRGNVGTALPLAGTGWVRLRYRDGRITVFAGTGVGTTPPAAWTKTHDLDWTGSAVPVLSYVRMAALMFSASGTPLVTQWDSIRYVDLEAT